MKKESERNLFLLQYSGFLFFSPGIFHSFRHLSEIMIIEQGLLAFFILENAHVQFEFVLIVREQLKFRSVL